MRRLSCLRYSGRSTDAVALSSYTAFQELQDLSGIHTTELGRRVHRGYDLTLRIQHELGKLDDHIVLPDTWKGSHGFDVFARYSVGDWESDALLAPELSGSSLIVGAGSDDLYPHPLKQRQV